KILYKYPQREFPYAQLVEENGRRKGDSGQPEFELLDTGIFDDDRYFDVFVEYAKAGPEDILMRVTVHNRGPEEATIHLLPQLWFRNTWSWKPDAKKPELSLGKSSTISAKHAELGDYTLSCEGKPELLFCNNETNARRLYGHSPSLISTSPLPRVCARRMNFMRSCRRTTVMPMRVTFSARRSPA